MSVVEIFNQALSACGAEIGITDPDENSREAALCRLWYPTVRDNVLAAARWPSTRRYARLALMQERDFQAAWGSSDPDPEFRYAFGPPADLQLPYHLQSYGRFAYRRGVISANEPTPILYYNAKVSNPADWETGLRLAVVHTLATYLAKPLTGRSSTLEENASMAFGLIEEVQTRAANEEQVAEEVLPSWIQARGYANPQQPRFFYPLNSLNVAKSQ